MVEEIKAVDLDEAEAIGKGLQERHLEKPTETPSDFETWDNDGFRERVRQVLLAGKMMDVDISQIHVPAQGLAKYQFRRTREYTYGGPDDDYDNADELKESIKANGVLEPIILQQKEDYFYIIDGHSRFMLWKQAVAENAELPKPTFLVLDCPDSVAMQLAAELNRNGQNLSGEDASVLIIRLYEEGKIRQGDIATLMNLSKSYVSEVISAFRDVPPEARALIESGAWTVKHGRELSRLKEHEKEQLRIMKQAISTKYDSAIMEEKVDSALAKMKWEKEAAKRLKTADIQTEVEGEELGTLTTKQVEKIHQEILEDTTERLHPYMGDTHHVTKVGKGQYEPTPAATAKILKGMGYEVVAGEATTSPGEQAEPAKPTMPTPTEIMQENQFYKSICPYCGGRTHPVVADDIGFKTQDSYNGGKGGHAHIYCILSDRIEDRKKEIRELEAKLAKDDLTLLIKSGQSLEDINNRSHQLYKDELERRKQEWREKNLPDAAKKAASKKAPLEKKTNLFDLIEQVRKADPSLVPEQYWDAYLKYQKQEDGWESLPSVAKSLGLKSHGSVLKQFQKIGSAIEGVTA